MCPWSLWSNKKNIFFAMWIHGTDIVFVQIYTTTTTTTCFYTNLHYSGGRFRRSQQHIFTTQYIYILYNIITFLRVCSSMFTTQCPSVVNIRGHWHTNTGGAFPTMKAAQFFFLNFFWAFPMSESGTSSIACAYDRAQSGFTTLGHCVVMVFSSTNY